MRRLVTTVLLLTLCAAGCTAGEGASNLETAGSVETTARSTPVAMTEVTLIPEAPAAERLEPTPLPTPSATPIPIYHASPYTVVIDAGHGGPSYFGASGRGADGTLYIEKDLALSVALRLRDLLAADGYNVVLTRDGDYTLTPFDPASYRPSMIADLQARVDVANAVRADLLVSMHFNGWIDASVSGTEAYCNPDREFGTESCAASDFIQSALMVAIRQAGNPINDTGTRNDAEVNGDPANPHSYLLGTNANFNPSLMPGVITEVLFLSSPSDVKFLSKPEATDVMAEGFREGIRDYFGWLTGY